MLNGRDIRDKRDLRDLRDRDLRDRDLSERVFVLLKLSLATAPLKGHSLSFRRSFRGCRSHGFSRHGWAAAPADAAPDCPYRLFRRAPTWSGDACVRQGEVGAAQPKNPFHHFLDNFGADSPLFQDKGFRNFKDLDFHIIGIDDCRS